MSAGPLALVLPNRPSADRSDYPVLNPSARAVPRFSPACTLASPRPGCATGIFSFFRRTSLQGGKRWYYHSCLFSVPAPPFARERPAGFLLRQRFLRPPGVLLAGASFRFSGAILAIFTCDSFHRRLLGVAEAHQSPPVVVLYREVAARCLSALNHKFRISCPPGKNPGDQREQSFP